MEIIVGKTAGFCYGVKRAIDGVKEESKNNKLFCIGEIVHNRQVIEDLQNKGVNFVEDISKVHDAKSKVAIRAHGVKKEVYEIANKNKIDIIDYTCPNVLRIHEIAKEYAEKGFYIILCGKKEHPENIGTLSYCGKNYSVIQDEKELKEALKEGYECYVFFVIQMSGVRYFTPNTDTHPEFKEALKEAAEAGVHVVAYDCSVKEDEIRIQDQVPVVLDNPELYELSQVLVPWYQKARRDLPWRHTTDPYRIWVSEIMLQQTRVEAVKRYYARFMEALPNVNALANVEEDKLLKLWEGLGYYNRVRNMQKAARQIMVDYNGTFPKTYEEIQSLTGIGNYTAGAISSFSFGLPYPAVDGNVLRVITRITADDSDIMKQSTRKQIEEKLKKVIPKDCAGDFNQGLIELGAIVCVPNGEPKCEECPAAPFCQARIQGKIQELPVKEKAKARRIEKKTVFILRDEDKIAICKRPAKGLLAGLYELPNIEEHLNKKEITQYCKEIGLMPIHIKKLPTAKHIFSHIEWQMIGYDIRVDELEKTNNKKYLFIHPEEIQKEYPIPSAFEKYMKLI